MRITLSCALLLAFIFGPVTDLIAQKGPVRVTEIFRLSRVGQANAAETRELLVPIYKLAAAEHDAGIERQRAGSQKVYRGHQVRILQVLGESDGHGALYLCAYAGQPCVFSIAGDRWGGGELTPALIVEEDGTHETSVTRTVSTKKGLPNAKPSLEVVDDSDGGAVSFFGIPLVFDDGPSPRRKSPPSVPAPKRPGGAETKKITETKSYPKYRASVSTELLEEGPPLMSTALFLELVKNGKIFTVARDEKRRCQECRGFGRITTTMPVGQRDPDGKMPCPDCRGAGDIDYHVTYLVTW